MKNALLALTMLSAVSGAALAQQAPPSQIYNGSGPISSTNPFQVQIPSGFPVTVTDPAVEAAMGTPNDAAAVTTGSMIAQLRHANNLLASLPSPAINADGGETVHIANPSLAVAPRTLTMAAPAAVSFPVNAATTAITAGTIANGCDFVNTGSVTLYVSSYGTATASNIPLFPGQPYHCPGPTAQGISIFNASTTVVGSIAGQVY